MCKLIVLFTIIIDIYSLFIRPRPILPACGCRRGYDARTNKFPRRFKIDKAKIDTSAAHKKVPDNLPPAVPKNLFLK